MDEQWQRVRILFHEALEQPEAERDVWLQRECAHDPPLLSRLRELLDMPLATSSVLADRATALLGRLLPEATEAESAIGDRVGVYRLLRLLGVGGMGRVYLAERADGEFRHQVALKFLRSEFSTPELRQRFLRERETLARLTHPNIAQLHDGGVGADGTPYFTLEFIAGEPITRWCDEHAIDVRGRIRLIVKVCEAVDYAHRNLVVHRDLKPSNILVTNAGEPKLLDFGIAKLLEQDAAADALTGTQNRLMTPEFAAPEQVLGEPITTATDVYALGVLIYFLLCGHMPYRRVAAGSSGLIKAILEENPEPLSRAIERTSPAEPASGNDQDAPPQFGTDASAQAIAAARGVSPQALKRVLRGDIERIIQRALSKTPDTRYPTASALAEDLRAWLDGRAISGGSRRYRLRKFVRRYWLPLAAAATILLVLVGSGAVVVWQARQTEHEARTTLAVKDFLFGLFTAVDPREAKGREVSAHELLDRGAERIGRNRNLDQMQKAEIGATLGRIYYQLGLYDQADKLQADAIKVLATNDAQTSLFAQAQVERADTLAGLGDLKSAATLADDARTRVDALPNASIVDLARVLRTQARIASDQRDFAALKRYADAVLALVRNAEVDPRLLYDALLDAGAASWGLSKPEEAESYFREALAVASRDAGPDDLDVANARANLGMALQGQSRFAEARQMKQQALTTDEKMLGPDHPVTLSVRRDLGLAYFHLGLYPQARAALEQTLAAQRRKLGDEHPTLAGTEINLGLVLIDSGDLVEADRILTEALDIFQKKYGRDYQGTQIVLGNLGLMHMLQGNLERAENELAEVMDKENKPGLAAHDGFITFYRLGEVKRRRGDTKAAIELESDALAAAQKIHGENSRYTAMAHHLLALALRDQGDTAGAERELHAALASYAGYIPQAEHPLAATSRYELGLLLIQRDADRPEGIRLLTEATALREKFLGPDEPRTKQARDALSKAQNLKKH
ncbi:serine/threonine-protein kinase [Pseudolysobacter antarcticus]|uniref:serine/threonine-protein kinase n=1 Tax=Pseudolysobacter antarcticus TaxID=2511995 RepID=UPI0013EC64C9|nr:serine/threonine-protein kinase [Pseudolysobacter antarcticus]